MSRFLLAVPAAFVALSGLAAQTADPPVPPSDQAAPGEAAEDADARWQRLQAEAAATRARREADQQRYEQGVRDAEAARLRYEADMARHRAEVERSEAARADFERANAEYERTMAEREAQASARRARRDRGESATAAEAAPARAAGVTSPASCAERQARSRSRGRSVGRVVGGIAGGLVGGQDSAAGALAGGLIGGIAVGELLGEAFVRLLDCDEQVQAAAATAEAVRGGVGTTANWTSQTRPGVTGSSTVLAAEEQGGESCLTVTDIVIIDGEETRAPKRMCRRPPSNRYVRA